MRKVPPGFTATHEIVVTDAMTVDFEDRRDPAMGRLHPVYATYWLAKHMELVSRKLILPFLEEGDAGIGQSVSVTHLTSALPGMRVSLTARCERHDGNRVQATCQAVSELGDVVGEGATVQAIVSAEKLERGFARLRERLAAARAGR